MFRRQLFPGENKTPGFPRETKADKIPEEIGAPKMPGTLETLRRSMPEETRAPNVLLAIVFWLRHWRPGIPEWMLMVYLFYLSIVWRGSKHIHGYSFRISMPGETGAHKTPGEN